MEKFKFYKNKTVLISGGDGFIGSHLVECLLNSGAILRVIGRSKKPKLLKISPNLEYLTINLENYNLCKEVCKGIDFVFHLAGKAGSIEYNKKYQEAIFTNNLLVNLNILKAASNFGVKRFQFVSSVTVYPKTVSIPTPEIEGMIGDPESANFGYGWSKRAGEILCKLYAEEFGIKMSIIRPNNTYGPRDNFDPSSARVIPDLIRKVHEAKNTLVVWGSGKQKRTFVYVEDVVRGILLGMKEYAKPDPVNITTDEIVTIKQLVENILEISGKKLVIKYDRSKPEGDPIRCPDIKKAYRFLKFRPRCGLKDGLKATIDWFKEYYKKPN